MRARPIGLLLAFAFFAVLAGPLAAQETAPATDDPASDSNNPYADLRESTDKLTKGYADRYANLVKSQEWADLTGKFKRIAKYVEHDPNMQWVTLEIAQGRGAERVVRQVKIPLDKLSKACQSRVRQISVMQVKLDELAVAEEDRVANGGSGEMADSRGELGRGGGEETTRGRSSRNRTNQRMAEEATMEEAEPAIETTSTMLAVDDGSNDPDPLGFAELEGQLSAGPPPGDSSGVEQQRRSDH